ncbi:MAG TPA: TonB family protein [Aquabacterium sp.]|nr:TonB family protein [Aquabacterium sp.]
MLQRLRDLWNRLTLLSICLGGSVLAHVGLFSFRLVDPEGFNRMFQDTPLEVILVNAGSDSAPEKAQALAQLNLAGGGEADQGRATSPLPPSPDNETGEALEQTTRMIEQMQREQQQLLAMVRNELAALPPPQPHDQADTPQARAEEERRRQLTKLLAEIERRIKEENARPKKRYLSPATMKSVDALYYSAFRTRVERAGTEHFPSVNGQKIYGDLVMETWLDHNGKVVDAIVTRSSGNKLLDKRARAIVTDAGPFGAVPPDVMAGRDLLLISSRFRFTREAGLEATTTVPTSPTVP